MVFTVTPLAQKARTKTLIADSDLNLGNYDLIATDVRGDTAEFGELHVEGSINNVNITDNGEITTAQGVNGADFNGAKITSTKFNGATIDTSGNVTGVKGTFSGAVTGATGTFSGKVSASNISSSNAWVLVLSTTSPNTSNYPFTINTIGTVNSGSFGQLFFSVNATTITANSSLSRIVAYNPHNDAYGITPITDVKIESGSWSYTASTSNTSFSATFNNKTITNSGVSMTLSEVKSMLTTPFNSTFKNLTANNISGYNIMLRFNNTSSSTQYGYIVPFDMIS